MRLKIDNVTDNTTKNSLQKDRNEIMKTIHRKMKEIDKKKIGKSSEGIWKQWERFFDDVSGDKRNSTSKTKNGAPD